MTAAFMVDPITKLAFDLRIATQVSLVELRNARALGYSHASAYLSSYDALDGVLDISRRPMPADVLTRFRPLTANDRGVSP